MMQRSVTVKIEWSAGHRIFPYEGKCERPHGHNYRAFITLGAAVLDGNDMVLDFAVLKKDIGAWIDTYWDHAFLLDSRDEQLRSALELVPEAKIFLFESRKPTAEILAQTLVEVVSGMDLPVQEVQIWETDKQYASVSQTSPES